MKYSRNAVYNRIRDAVKADFPDAYCTSRYVEDVQWESAFEIQVVSNKKNTAASEAYNIMNTAKAAFSKLYYREFSETNIDTGDTFTIVGRFRRRIGGGDTMPTDN